MLDGSLALVVQILAGISLAACCGLRAFLPPLVVGLAARLGALDLIFGGSVPLNAGFEWMASTPALVVFGVALFFEVLADKVPVVDHMLDVVQTVVRPLAGAVVVAASLEEVSPLAATVVGLIVGSATAGGVHLAKAKVRVVSNLSSVGFAAPFISLLEDVTALLGSLISVFLAALAAVFVVALAVLLWMFYRRIKRDPVSTLPSA